MLIGSYNHQLDQKNRFRIPTKLKLGLGDELVLTKGSNHSLYILNKENMEINIYSKMANVSLFGNSPNKRRYTTSSKPKRFSASALFTNTSIS